jgi:hypothetical protein
MSEKETKVVPPRNDPKKGAVLVRAEIQDQAGARPGFVRKWFHKDDPQHRSYYERYTKRYAVGDPEVGHYWVEPWNVVDIDSAKPGRTRDDQGKAVHSALTHGDLICLETPAENYAVIEEVERLQDRAKAKRLRQGDSESYRADNGGVATYKARSGDAATHRELLDRNPTE